MKFLLRMQLYAIKWSTAKLRKICLYTNSTGAASEMGIINTEEKDRERNDIAYKLKHQSAA